MKKQILIILITLFTIFISNAQERFFIGEKSYPCTESIRLSGRSGGAASNSVFNTNVSVLIAKKEKTGIFVFRTGSPTKIRVKGKLLIYLENGTVITCIDRGKYDYVDKTATTIYYLTKEELNKMKNSNIDTVRYTLGSGPFARDYTASNVSYYNMFDQEIEKTNVPALIKKLFN